jgi:putative ABC transport system substrate-binding protein
LTLLAAPLVTETQPAGKVYRIAYLGSTPPTSQSAWDGFLQGLRDHGWIDGQNIVIERRFTGGRPERFPELIAEVLQIPVDLIVVADSQAAWAAKRATTTTPIILGILADALRQGLIASYARPDGNITGLDNQIGEVAGKRMHLLKQIVPKVGRLALVYNPNNPSSNLRLEEASASQLGLKVIAVPFRTAADLEPALAMIAHEHADAILPHIASPIGEHWPQFIEFAHKQRLPTAGLTRGFVELGGLFYYGPDSRDLWRRTAYYVDRVLRGAKPVDLPVEQPTKFELVINLKTAKALGLTIPPSVLARAYEVTQ